MKSKKQSTSKDTEVVTFSRNWQQVRQELLPSLFCAYDTQENQSERLVTFRMNANDLQKFYEGVSDLKKLELIVHLGVTQEDVPNRIPEIPIFTLFIQTSEKKDDFQKKCFQLEWAPNARFTNGEEDDANSGRNAIPAASAYLFVMSWMETPEKDLALPFTAVSHVLGKRVKNYRFSNVESRSIFEDIKQSLKSGAPGLDIHLGNGLAVYDHPFSFRPVIEVKNAVKVDKNGRVKNKAMVARNATGLLNGSGDSFYDFGLPEPPPPPPPGG
ncbi:hypothetical protein [Neolewinella persica]|uniref:hypothetical protein n=1 Tax=Neolewinella persica TaxID=70998 RepID=UPI000373DA06|nr:hypothetical protein [Neolewinella persica]